MEKSKLDQSLADTTSKDYKGMESKVADQAFLNFRERTSKYPDQVKLHSVLPLRLVLWLLPTYRSALHGVLIRSLLIFQEERFPYCAHS